LGDDAPYVGITGVDWHPESKNIKHAISISIEYPQNAFTFAPPVVLQRNLWKKYNHKNRLSKALCAKDASNLFCTIRQLLDMIIHRIVWHIV